MSATAGCYRPVHLAQRGGGQPAPGLLLSWALAFRDYEVAAPDPGPNQAFFPQHRQCPLCRALGDSVLLREALDRWDAPRQLADLDLAAQDACQLQVQRLLRVMINAHMITLGNLCAHQWF